MATAVWEYLNALAKYDGSEKAHEDVIKTLQAHGHKVKWTDAWCTETQMAALYDCGAVDLVGGYSASAAQLKKKASTKSKSMVHKGSGGALPGDIMLFGSGEPNHTEGVIGYQINVSGNYNGGCSRRSYTGRSVHGYIRPKWAIKEMDNLQIVVEASECILGTYGTNNTRKKMLAVFGRDNAEKIQDEIDRVWNDMNMILFDMAVYVIFGRAGKGKYRKKRLGNYAERVQDKIEEIYALRGRSIEDAAQLVLDGKFGTNAVRRLLLRFCGYDPEKVQAAVNDALEAPAKPQTGEIKTGSIISLFRDKARGTKSVDGLQGDCIIVKDDTGSALIMDTYRSGALEKITKEIAGCKTVDLFFTHPHSDHMSANANSLIKKKLIRRCYVPAEITIASDYKNRYRTLIEDCKKYGVEAIVLRQGSIFQCGKIRGTVVFQQSNSSTDSVNMRSLCTLIEVAGIRMLNCGDHHCGMKESLFNPDKVGHVHVYVSSHHGLYTGDTDDFVKAISPDWTLHTGWKSWPLGSVCQDAKTKAAQKVYQKYGILLPGDVVGRTELTIENGMITAKGEKNMTGKTVSYILDGRTCQKTVHVCTKTAFVAVRSMIPEGAELIT